jgi:dTDP-4-dehydrorhamnose 3,5-epimerase
MDIIKFDVPDLKLIVPQRFSDARGFFAQTWTDRDFKLRIADLSFVQDNHSMSAHKGTVRGLHFQKPPFAQGKLVSVVRGAILDVAVDIRKGSPTYRRHVGIRLDAAEGAQLWVPPGFLHGFCTLEDHTEVVYKVTSYYSPNNDAGVLWNDPSLEIDWPVKKKEAILSAKDEKLPLLVDLPDHFHFYKQREIILCES